MRQKAKLVNHADMVSMHRLRIRGKKTRYMLEWHAQHHSDKDTIRLAGKLQQFQECLGEIHDSDQGLSLLHELRHGIEDAGLISEIACLVGWQSRRGHDAIQQFDDLSEKCRFTIKQWLKDRC